MVFPPDNVENWIFATGMIRSGTTFLATVLSQPLSVDYIHEPFNGAYTLPERVALRPRYVRPDDTSYAVKRYRDQVEHLFDYRIGMRAARYDDDPVVRKWMKRVVGSRGPFYLRFAKVNPFREHVLIKDPMAGLTTEFLYREFHVRPVIIVRHPVSLAASLQRLHWYPQVYDFQLQPNLVEDYLGNDRSLLDRSYPSRLHEAMAHWRLLYTVLLEQANRHNWVVVTHEELCERPEDTFRTLYQKLDLPWTSSTKRLIHRLTDSDESVDAKDGRVQDFKRDSAAIFERRRDSISVDLRRSIYDLTGPVADRLYNPSTFALHV